MKSNIGRFKLTLITCDHNWCSYYFQKEVSRLWGLVNGGAENLDNDASVVTFLGSPGSFKWEGLYGSFSPLMSEKRMSQVSIVCS